MLEGPSGKPTRATEVCTIVFPLEGPQGRKLEIYALVVDTLEEYCGVHQNSMRKWQMQLGIGEDEILPWLQVAQPGDRHWCKLTMDRVTLNPGGVSRSMWKFLVCKVRQMKETMWLTAARAWGMPVSRISAEAVTRLGLTERPNEWCQVTGEAMRCRRTAGRQVPCQDPEHIGDRTTGLSDDEETPREENFKRPDVVIGTGRQ
jgi:hypothetical protein